MRTLVHLSDLHFGRIDQSLISPLTKLVGSLEPDVVVVSGDLTQRAKTREFKAARRFIDGLPAPQIVVPGNHDVPLYNLFNRFVRPLDRFCRHIDDDLEPAHVDGELAVLGLNTARALTFKNGRVNRKQIERLRTRLNSLDKHVMKVVVTHHPFDLPEQYDNSDLVGRAAAAMAMFAECGVDLLLAGHMHASASRSTALRYEHNGYSAVAIQAGSATSTRLRSEPNSFNVLRIAPARITIQKYESRPAGAGFAPHQIQVFERTGNTWLGPIATPAPVRGK